MTRTRSQSTKSAKSARSTKSVAISLSESAKIAYKDFRVHGFGAIPTRYIIVLVALTANTYSYTCRTNMSVTIVAMVNGSALRQLEVNQTDISTNNITTFESCPAFDGSGNETIHHDTDGEFIWSSTMQGHILGAFYYGYIATNVNGGQLADWCGVRWLCAMVTLSSALLTGLTPFFARWDPIALIVLRVITGLAQGILTPAIYAMLAHWIPRHERGVVLALVQVGGNIGAVLTLPLSGFLAKTGLLGGWPLVFYVLGAFGAFCFVWWIYCIYDKPEQHPRISGHELIYIQTNVTVSQVKKEQDPVPWIPIFLSLPMWAVAAAKFCGAWGNLMLMSKLPTYLESVLHMPIEMNGVISAVVYLALSISLTFFGFVSDMVGRRRLIPETLSRKIFETIALGGPAVCLAMIPIVGCNQTMVIVLLVVALTIFGFNAGGDKPIVVDIAPDHSGTIYGITNAIASLPGILAPLLVGMVIGNQYGSLSRWNIVFYSATAIYIFGAIFFVVFGTAKAQPWGISAARSRRCTEMSRNSSRAVSRANSRRPSRATPSIEPKTKKKSEFGAELSNISKINNSNGLVGQPNSGIFIYVTPDEDDDLEEFEDEEEDEDQKYNTIHFEERRFSIFPIS